ncbi:MAG TPA: GNAT family N-acetyltransferase [Candidatus Limnocylindria bacterium]|nr:GNAT family N-acetyltransferase [Candidatus Limnocylindria bacterium]
MASLDIRELVPHERGVAAGVAARAFFDEEFMVGMMGADPLTRLEGSHRLYSEEPWHTGALHLAAFAGSTMVGVVRASPLGRCFVCFGVDPTKRPDDDVAANEWEFERAVQAVHLRHPEHAWISRVAVEPQLHGAGVGSALLAAAVDRVTDRPDTMVLLECLSTRESFYVRNGFHRLDDVPDPFAEGTLLMAQTATGSSSAN